MYKFISLYTLWLPFRMLKSVNVWHFFLSVFIFLFFMVCSFFLFRRYRKSVIKCHVICLSTCRQEPIQINILIFFSFRFRLFYPKTEKKIHEMLLELLYRHNFLFSCLIFCLYFMFIDIPSFKIIA